MPSRHISPQSFDELLDELGDDPAIPDPHGIRKPTAPKVQAKAPIQLQLPASMELKKIGILIGLGVGLICLALYLLNPFKPLFPDSSIAVESMHHEISQLQKELATLREETLDIENELYDAIDLLEVSIHSYKQNKGSTNSKTKVPSTPFESELRQWRYLGLSQVGTSQHAFFHNGKGTVMLEKGAISLGDWKLTNLDKALATFSHPQGKSFDLKPSRSE